VQHQQAVWQLHAYAKVSVHENEHSYSYRQQQLPACLQLKHPFLVAYQMEQVSTNSHRGMMCNPHDGLMAKTRMLAVRQKTSLTFVIRSWSADANKYCLIFII